MLAPINSRETVLQIWEYINKLLEDMIIKFVDYTERIAKTLEGSFKFRKI